MFTRLVILFIRCDAVLDAPGHKRCRRPGVEDARVNFSELTCALIDLSFTPFPFLMTENYGLRNLMPEVSGNFFAAVMRSTNILIARKQYA
jgi:hypothetical protein